METVILNSKRHVNTEEIAPKHMVCVTCFDIVMSQQTKNQTHK